MIRHAIGIDERRAKFRPELIEKAQFNEASTADTSKAADTAGAPQDANAADIPEEINTASQSGTGNAPVLLFPGPTGNPDIAFAPPIGQGLPNSLVTHKATGIYERREKFRPELIEKAHITKDASTADTLQDPNAADIPENTSTASQSGPGNAPVLPFSDPKGNLGVASDPPIGQALPNSPINIDSDNEGEDAKQDIQEVWFPGGHCDIGGGWSLRDGEVVALSHGPLVWMVSIPAHPTSTTITRTWSTNPGYRKQINEAMKAGVAFDEERMDNLKCLIDESKYLTKLDERILEEIEPSGKDLDPPQTSTPAPETKETGKPDARTHLLNSYTSGKVHDCLLYPSGGVPLAQTIGWKAMEWLPFRRMDLQPDGSWKPISWPLPRGEVRDIPQNAKVHNSAFKRMLADPEYRPGNLLVDGGGRRVRKAPPDPNAHTRKWEVDRDMGSLVHEVHVTKK